MKRTFIAILLSVILVGVMCLGAGAADYPKKPIKLIINFSAGGTTDVAARFMVNKAEKVLGGKFVCVNEPGAGGTLGVASVSRAKGDGYTIGTCNMPALAIIPQIRQVPYDPLKAFTHIAAVMPYEYALMVRADSPWKTWEDFVAYVKKNPGKVSYGSVGTGTTNHLATARIGQKLGLEWKHVPFQGGVKETAALLGGHVEVINNTMASVVSSVKAGKIRLLLVTSEDRVAVAPNVPTMKDKGFDFSQISYMSILAPAGLPENIRAKLEAAFKAAVDDPTVRKECNKLDLNPKFMSGKAYAALVQKLAKEWGALLPSLGVKAKK